jgi:protein TonB
MLLRFASILALLVVSGQAAAQNDFSTLVQGHSEPKQDPATSSSEPAAAGAAAAKVYFTADEPPVFKGGPEGLQKFLNKELQYPEEALRRELSGKVYVRFLITEKGRTQDAEIVKSVGGGLDEEALRLVRIMPWWTPARVQGQPVRLVYTMPIVFRALN